jgi:hypothetical protein
MRNTGRRATGYLVLDELVLVLVACACACACELVHVQVLAKEYSEQSFF